MGLVKMGLWDLIGVGQAGIRQLGCRLACRSWTVYFKVTAIVARGNVLQRRAKPTPLALCLQVDLKRALKANSIREFDSALVAPAYGFKTVGTGRARTEAQGSALTPRNP